MFAGTGVVANEAIKQYEKVVVNDLLYSNNVIYNAFWGKGRVNGKKLLRLFDEYNSLDSLELKPNYFSVNFGGKYFDELEAKKIGFVREDIEQRKDELSTKEYNILLASLIYGMDKIANTLGHYEAYIGLRRFPKAWLQDLRYRRHRKVLREGRRQVRSGEQDRRRPPERPRHHLEQAGEPHHQHAVSKARRHQGRTRHPQGRHQECAR